MVPHTKYALWFLDSLRLMSATAVIYSLITLYRPVLYRFRVHPHECDKARELTGKWGRTSLDFFKYQPDKSFFFSPSGNSFLAYRVSGGYALTLGDPVGPDEDVGGTIEAFMAFCADNGWRYGFHQTSSGFLDLYDRLGFKRLKIGDEAIVDIKGYSLQGSKNKHFRNRINKLEEEGFHFVIYKPPIPKQVLTDLKPVSDEWLRIPGRRERSFTIGSFEPDYVRSTIVSAVIDPNGTILAFANTIPSYHKGESTIDLMRHRIEVPNGIMDYLFVKHFLFLQESGFERFSMGLAPMSGFQETEDATLEERSIHYFVSHLNFMFSFTGLRKYKAKFATAWEPRYLIYRSALDLPGLAITITRISEL